MQNINIHLSVKIKTKRKYTEVQRSAYSLKTVLKIF